MAGGVDRGTRSDAARREALASAGQRARDRGPAQRYDVRGGGYRPRSATRGGGGARRWTIILATIGVLLVVAWIALPPLAGGLFRRHE